ncbi:MAG: SDR family oxidoreductase [Colwellia sp.]|nr:SDR family oxidoreductase [Colwellia sp.]
MNQDNQWNGKVVLVTGGGSGMGRDVCLALAREGAQIILGNRDAQAGQSVVDEITSAGGEAAFQVTEIANAEDCEALVQFAVDTYGQLDCAFNNSGIQREFGPIHETAVKDISETIDVNLKGTLYLMKYETAAMLKNSGGAIVNNASIFGLKGMANTPEYIASKHGIVGATKAVALDYAKENIRVNAVCPGPIKTPGYDRVTGGDDHMYDDGVPMHRIGRLEEVTSAVIWLLSEQASYVTGTTLSIDGGMSAE